MFTPNEVIFSATSDCNLHCSHCFVSKNPDKLDISTAINFLKSCKDYEISTSGHNTNPIKIEKIGFSGGEPFLYIDFLTQVIKAAVEMDFMFDQIMTNGDWWQDTQDLTQKLQFIYNAGYDGKIGLSWDSFHNQNSQRILTFITTVQQIFGPDSLNIQTVIPYDNPDFQLPQTTAPVYKLQQSFPGDDPRAWSTKLFSKWFKEDFCQGPGNILYVHSNGNIAPCCGFANENPALFIGTIQDSLQTVLKNASENKMIQICYQTGLTNYRKQLKKQGIIFPGKCSDNCAFCDYVMKLSEI